MEAVEGGVAVGALVLIQSAMSVVSQVISLVNAETVEVQEDVKVVARLGTEGAQVMAAEVTVHVVSLLGVAVCHLVVATIAGHLTVDVTRFHTLMEMASETDTGAGTEDNKLASAVC